MKCPEFRRYAARETHPIYRSSSKSVNRRGGLPFDAFDLTSQNGIPGDFFCKGRSRAKRFYGVNPCNYHVLLLPSNAALSCAAAPAFAKSAKAGIFCPSGAAEIKSEGSAARHLLS